MKPTREKRTTTQPGLGKVSAERRSTLGAGIEADLHIEHAPISAPPPSGGNRHGRMTLPLEKAVNQPEGHVVAPAEQPASSARSRSIPSGGDPRSDGEPSSSGRIDRVDTQPRRNSSARQSFDVGAEKKRVPNRMSSKPPSFKPASSKPASSKPPSRPSKEAEARDLERRGSVGGFSAVEIATGRRPISGTAGAPVAVAVAAAGPARSKRVSIREDNVGQRVNDVDAIGVASRCVPRILKSKAELAAAPIDHRAGFLLAHIDGVTSVTGLVDITGMSEEEVDQILERLRRLGIVAVR